MRYAVTFVAAVLLLSACSSDQVSTVGQQNQLQDNHQIIKAVDRIPKDKFLNVPLDGRLRDEHMQMYVSVKIKQEQIRYEQAITYIKNVKPKQNTSGTKDNIKLEKLALKNFGFDPVLFYWAKRVIDSTSQRYASGEHGKHKRSANFEEAVAAHNLSMIDKYEDELQFVKNYKLRPPTTSKTHTVKNRQATSKQQMALFVKPSY